jgi:hypothetical protein
VSVPTKLRFERARGWYATLRHYHQIAEVGQIARRYFAMNAFDGVLTAVGSWWEAIWAESTALAPS